MQAEARGSLRPDPMSRDQVGSYTEGSVGCDGCECDHHDQPKGVGRLTSPIVCEGNTQCGLQGVTRKPPAAMQAEARGSLRPDPMSLGSGQINRIKPMSVSAS